MSDGEDGRLIGIAVRSGYRALMQTRESVLVSAAAGVEGDYRGAKYPRRAVTVLAREGWDAALEALGAPGIDWTARRANLLVEGAALPRAAGGVLRIGAVVLEVTGQTSPCSRMEEVRPGLLRALSPDWRGGITCRVVEDGRIALGDSVEILVSPPERKIRLPG